MFKMFGARGSGSVPIEATLALLGIQYELIEAVTWENEAARKRVEVVNPLRQVPALALSSGEIMTESAAILIYLADLYPQARLRPGSATPSVRNISAGWPMYRRLSMLLAGSWMIQYALSPAKSRHLTWSTASATEEPIAGT